MKQRHCGALDVPRDRIRRSVAMGVRRRALFSACTALITAACGGSGGASAPPPPPPPPAPLTPSFVTPPPSARVSAPSTFTANCDGTASTGTLFVNAEVEPHVALNPTASGNWVGSWQQNRWSDGAANGVLLAVTRDEGINWTRVAVPFSRCTGGTVANGGDYARATDPWVSFAPNGTVYAMALAVTGQSFATGSASAMRVARAIDGGLNWDPPITLIADGAGAFNDKNTITADPTDARYAYAVWDRLVPNGGGPLYFARTVDGGLTWQPARAIFDPGPTSQTIGGAIAVLPNGTLVALFTRIDAGNITSLWIVRSIDKGDNWSAPIKVADLQAVGAFVPETREAIRDGAILGQIAAAPSGAVYVVWQDSRFSSGQIDAIAFARSTDGGLNWSAPARISAAADVQSFTPQIAVAPDGTIGVSYHDLRSDTADIATTPTDYWLARSRDGGATWSESRIAGPFDIQKAPNARGFFVGDYQGLAARGTGFISLFAQSTEDGPSNRTDVFALNLPLVTPAQGQALAAGAAAPMRPTTEVQRRMSERVADYLRRRGRPLPQAR